MSTLAFGADSVGDTGVAWLLAVLESNVLNKLSVSTEAVEAVSSGSVAGARRWLGGLGGEEVEDARDMPELWSTSTADVGAENPVVDVPVNSSRFAHSPATWVCKETESVVPEEDTGIDIVSALVCPSKCRYSSTFPDDHTMAEPVARFSKHGTVAHAACSSAPGFMMGSP